LGTWNAPHGHSREWRRKRHRYNRSSDSLFLRYTVFALAAVLVITLAWRGIRWTAHPSYTSRVAATSSPDAAAMPPVAADPQSTWQRDYKDAVGLAAQDADAGNISQAEVAVDRAETIITAQRLESGVAPQEFFAPAVAAFDRVLTRHSDDVRLTEHVTLARISLAEFRSSLEADPTGVASYNYYGEEPVGGGGGTGDKPYIRQEAQTNNSKRVSLGAPREVAAGTTLDPDTAGAGILDATLMPDTAEILLPPSSRAFADNVRVENLFLQGAAQTLDGVHWRNVTFMNTRLRYEGGELDLQNVHFVRCRFGFTTDTGAGRSARLANAIALGQSSIRIE
jgi:hypothetical protein